jgi:hypothetical protein
MEEEPTRRSARVDAVRKAHEVDPVPLEVAHKVHELLDAPPQTVQLPDNERGVVPELVERLEEAAPQLDCPGFGGGPHAWELT